MQYLKLSIDKPVIYESAGQFISPGERFRHQPRCLTSSILFIGIEGDVYIQEDDMRYVLHPGDALILRAGHPHVGWAYTEGRASFFWSHFRCKISGTNDSNERPVDEETKKIIFLPQYIEKTALSDKWIIHFHQLMDMSESNFSHPRACDYLLTILLMSLQEVYWDSRASKYDSLTYKLLEHIRINAHKNISLAELADKFGYNGDYLSVYFRKQVGISIKEYAHKIRMQKAKKLLLTTEMSVKEIAANQGYNDLKYFSKVFKAYEHMTPTAYRNAFSNLHQNNL